MGGYNVARICLNGHMIGSEFVIPSRPGLRQTGDRFCERCGEPIITECPTCGAELRGTQQVSYRVPFYCRSCGKPYPWTDRKIQEARELIDLDTALAAEEKEAFKADIVVITTDVPRTKAAAIRVKRFLNGAGAALRDIVVELASEAAKRIIFGN